MERDKVLLAPTYLGNVEYFWWLVNNDVTIDVCAHYQKQTYSNRCVIMTAGGPFALSIPVKKVPGKMVLRDVRIAYESDWQQLHWRAIESAYNSSAYFEYFRDELREIYDRKFNFLLDWNLVLQQKVLDWLGYDDVQPILTEHYVSDTEGYKNDLRELLQPKAKCVSLHSVSTESYYQLFGNRYGFVGNLSIIDMVFNIGREARLILKK